MSEQKSIWWKMSWHAVLIVVSFVMLYPILWMLFSSLKPESEIFSTAQLLPKVWTFKHYINGFSGDGIPFGLYFYHSMLISILVVIGTVLSSSITGFAFSRLRFSGRRFLFGYMLATLMLPAQVVMIPQYILFHRLHLVNTFIPLILPSFLATVPFFIFLMVQFIRGIPRDLDEAAFIDGCSRFRLFRSIIFPLLRPAIIVTGIFSFYWTWNDFFGQLIYLDTPQKYTVSVGLNLFLANIGKTQWGDMFAMSILSVIPVFVIFLIFQRYLVEGISTQGLKG